jgi:Glycosyl hydrolases family 2/Glycosyl hydrolases family 2, sugar binding domain/Glycosyl hydrolases family 2, TIM barrel domain
VLRLSEMDLFADIAREHPGKAIGCSEIEPLTYKKKYFTPSVKDVEEIVEPTYEEQLEGFHSQLERLRSVYKPFLMNHVPVSDVNRSARKLENFAFRYHTDQDSDILRVLNGDGEWEEVTIPDFRGPTKEKGKWTGYYRTQFTYQKNHNGKRIILAFKGVDYNATIYLNGRCIGSHEGFFAPFEFDITDTVRENNILVVEVQNDYPALGVNGKKLDGDKIYAATGLGWDDPEEGWHHCPPGGGIYNTVTLEERSDLHIKDIFVRPNIDENFVEVWVDVFNSLDNLIEDFKISVDILPRNFKGEALAKVVYDVEYAGPGINYYRYKISLKSYRLWELETPYLYTVRVGIVKSDLLVDQNDRNFGMRKFHQDEDSMPKGTLYFNNKPIILRGANEMGHLQWCVMRHDYDQLIDDILIAKLANINFYRMTQRPVQEDIYEYCDMLGMMHQTDLPLFSFLRRNQFSEAVKQSAEMERLIRSHPSSVMVSFINEPSMANKPGKRVKGHRHLFRDELEAFFVAARQAIYIENPDRVVKNTEGDYEPPTKMGMPDFHCYNMWYTNHTLPISKMYKGYVPEIKNDWKAGCGEYGAEGLDNYDLMMKYYPKDWLPKRDEEKWFPDRIKGAQTHSMHGDWYEEQSTIHNWIYESQQHQALAVKLMTDSLRRRADIIVSSAIHLLIDAWPSGWMKSLVGMDRIPKRGYFAYQKSLEPLRVNMRCDQWRAYSGDTIELESWLLNDTAKAYNDCEVIVTVRDEERIYGSFQTTANMAAVMPTYAGTVKFSLPEVTRRQDVYLDASLVDKYGTVLNKERIQLEVFPSPISPSFSNIRVIGENAVLLCRSLGLPAKSYENSDSSKQTILVSEPALYEKYKSDLQNKVKQGSTVIFLESHQGEFSYEWAGKVYTRTKMEQLFFVAINQEDARLEDFKSKDLAWLYNQELDLLDYTANAFFASQNLIPLVYSYQKPAFNTQTKGEKKKLAAVGAIKEEKGEAIFIGLPLKGKINVNPTLDLLFKRLILDENGSSNNLEIISQLSEKIST